MRVLTILARFGTEQYAEAQTHLNDLFTRQMPDARRSVIVVDNSLPRALVEPADETTLLGGDNRMFEFSAFDRALEYVGQEIRSYDLVHFATSAFNTLYTAYLDRFDARLLNEVSGRPVCVGHIDCYNDPVAILQFRSQHWIRSCFFFMPPTEVRLLGTLVSVSDRGLFFSGRPEAPFRPDAPISDRYRRYITDWLSGGDIGQGVEWHSSFRLSERTLPTFERKALSIINEHLLAIRLRAVGCRLIDVTWLSTQLSRLRAQEVIWATGWREQLASRDRDAIHLPQARETTAPSGA